MEKLAKFANNVWKTHKMEQLGQKWGSKSDLEPKNKGLTNFAIEISESPKMYRILQDFGVRANFATTLNDSTASFFDSVKSS
jgi:hypothetical protein